MIGDKLKYHSNYREINKKIIDKLKYQLQQNRRICIAVGGESGCGKTSLAYTLFKDIENEFNLKGFLFHADDYFYLPPKDNHNKRLKNISNVGAKEVNLELLDQHLSMFIKGSETINKPLVNYSENTIQTEIIEPGAYDFCIVEGTYAMLLNHAAYKLFIKKTFLETKSNRINRARDVLDDFNEEVLKIEHNIIKKQAKLADMVI